MLETYAERTVLAYLATDKEGRDAESLPPQRRIEVLHRCGTWTPKHGAFCLGCGSVLRRKDGSLI